ncbi:hypothetical protein [Mycobacterium phage Maco6]|uniref:Tail assembly chaperone n=1 Tax=Mycobacterium phage Maco2 TaxID=2805749 RepID=A0A899INI3_9CAUD|nr:hypothetical protein [Mycobacterium phage Maco2]UNY41941.1 hypothetical protein [Mycobacterium phage Maco6]
MQDLQASRSCALGPRGGGALLAALPSRPKPETAREKREGMSNTPVKRAPRKASPKPKKSLIPGEPGYDWRTIYPTSVKLFKFTSDDGFVVCLPKFRQPGEGEVFGLMLMDKSDQELLLHVLRECITADATNPQDALMVTFEALRKMKADGTVEKLLEEWPADAGVKLEK